MRALLEFEDFVDSDEMIKALWEAVYADLRDRDTYFGVWTLGDRIQRFYGPFYSERDVVKFFHNTHGPGVMRVGILHAPGLVKTHDEHLDSALKRKEE